MPSTERRPAGGIVVGVDGWWCSIAVLRWAAAGEIAWTIAASPVDEAVSTA